MVGMHKGRLEAFSDGVIAILITIMVLDLKAPKTADLSALIALGPALATYLVSFVFLGIYWNNHHHMLHATTRVNGKILWANLHLLFWLSLLPFVTDWVEEARFASTPMAAYGVVLLLSAASYTILQSAIIAEEGPDSKLAAALGKDVKGKLSLLCYLVAIPASFLHVWISGALYIAVALIWLVPDRRIESRLS